MNLALEIDTHDRALQFDLFGTRELEANKSATEIPGGARLELGTVYFRKGFGFPETIHAMLAVGRDVGIGLASAWLYDKLKGRATSVRINRIEVRLDKGEIERVITEQIEGKR